MEYKQGTCLKTQMALLKFNKLYLEATGSKASLEKLTMHPSVLYIISENQRLVIRNRYLGIYAVL